MLVSSFAHVRTVLPPVLSQIADLVLFTGAILEIPLPRTLEGNTARLPRHSRDCLAQH